MNYGLLECRGSGSHDTKCQAGNRSCTCQAGNYFFVFVFVFLSFFLRFLTASFFTNSVFLSFSSFIFALSSASLINCLIWGLKSVKVTRLNLPAFKTLAVRFPPAIFPLFPPPHLPDSLSQMVV